MRYLDLEGVLLTPFAVCKCVAELVSIQDRFHDTIDINLVACDQGIPVCVWFIPLYSDVAEITRPENQTITVE